MGSDDVLLRPNGFHLNGLLPNREASVTRKLDLERWTIAEERTAELIAHIQPDKFSWEHRNAIASYVQRLIAQCFSCVVFSYGSVPLKTYLPDGDIDLTVFSQDQDLNDNWAAEVRDVLQKEGKNEAAEYCVREVQLIHAEVKLVKCLVDNIVVDISFGQLSGLCTLCFLEEADRYIGQNHLFKRSIILIKAWCYYESRLLGAYHGLISTYALETLILYIFRVFNNSFAGPLEVLYRFLEFFSKFDWDNFCISLLGPVPIGSLPDTTAYPPRQDCDALLHSKAFLHACSMYYSVHPRTPVKEQFASKHFNIIDFLRTSNNLGRSVSKGNFFRIRSAFAFGAQRLAGLLDCSEESVVAELNRFFVNTSDRYQKVHRPDTTNFPAYNLGQEEPEHIAQKRFIKQNNLMAFDKGDKRINGNQMSLHGGEKGRLSDVLQNEVQFVHQFARTCSSPELTNSHKERGGQQKSISESDPSGKSGHSTVAVSYSSKINAVDPSTREDSPSESYDADDDSASVSSRCAADYAVGEDTISGVKPVQKSANVMHSPWIQTFGRQFVRFPLPESGWNLNYYHPHGLPAPSVPITVNFSNDAGTESCIQQVDDHCLWEDRVSSSTEQNTENGVFDSESNGSRPDKSLEERLGAVTRMDPYPVDDNNNGGQNGVPFSDAETAFPSFPAPHAGSLQFPPANINYPTPNWVFQMPLHPSWPTATNNYPPFPVAFLPAGLADPYASMPQYSTYTCQFNGKGENISVNPPVPTLETANNGIHQSQSSSKSKKIKEFASAEHSEQCASDILSSDISSHVNNMLYGRSCQSLHLQAPLFYRPPIIPPQYLQGQFVLVDPTANDAVLPETPLMPVSHHHSNQRGLKSGYQYYPKGVPNPGHGNGTGTYFPNPKSGRDFQNPNPRYHRGNYRNYRKEQHREREVCSNFNSRQRFGDRPGRWEKPNNSSFDRSAGRNHRAPLQWETYGNYSHPTCHPMVYDPTYMVYPYEPNSGCGSLEHPPDYANSSPEQPSSPLGLKEL